MRKIGVLATIWTLLLAIPFTALALSATAYITDHLTEIASAIGIFTRDVLSIERDWLLEAELIGMLAGQAIILVILAVTLITARRAESDNGS